MVFLNCILTIIQKSYLSFEYKVQTFFSNNNQAIEIPLKLTERNLNVLWIAMTGLAISFILLALSKQGTSKIVVIFSKIIFKNSSILKTINEEYSLSNFSSFLLIVNFILTTSLLTYLTFLHFLTFFPVYFFLWPLIWYNVIGLITNEQKIFKENKMNIIVLSQITGFFFSFLLLIWTFNLKWSNLLVYAFAGILVLFWIYKLFRGIIFSFQHQISWYYIFLYFCTLEILPLLLIFTIVLK